MKGENSATGAVCWTAASCFSLVVLFRLQFVIAIFVDAPLLPNRRPERGLEYLTTESDLYGLSFPQLWVALSVMFTVWAVVGVWMVSRGKHGRWRMRFVTLVFSAITLSFAVGMASSREHYVARARAVMWFHRCCIDEVIDHGGGAHRQLRDYQIHHEEMAKLRVVIEEEGALVDRERDEVTQILAKACSGLEDQALSFLHREGTLIREDIGVKPWREASWDPEEQEWVYRVSYGFVGYLEGRLPDWAGSVKIRL